MKQLTQNSCYVCGTVYVKKELDTILKLCDICYNKIFINTYKVGRVDILSESDLILWSTPMELQEAMLVCRYWNTIYKCPKYVIPINEYSLVNMHYMIG